MVGVGRSRLQEAGSGSGKGWTTLQRVQPWFRACRSALLDFLDFGVDDRLPRRRLRRFRLGAGRASSRAGRGLCIAVLLLAQLLAGGLQRVGLLLDGGLVFTLEGFL